MSANLVVGAIMVGILGLYAAGSWARYRLSLGRPRGVHFTAAAAAWAEPRFPTELRPMAAFVAEVLREHVHVEFMQLEPETRFVEDLGMDDLEPVEVAMALEHDLGIRIDDAEWEQVRTISEVVQLLHRWVPASE